MISNVPTYDHLVASMNYSDMQRKRFNGLCQEVKSGKLSMNQAYNKACDEQYMGAGGKFKGKFGEWMDTAREEGWIDKALGIGYHLASKDNEDKDGWFRDDKTIDDTQKKGSAGIWVAVGLIAIVGITLIATKAKKK
jgi:hypothetical protein